MELHVYNGVDDSKKKVLEKETRNDNSMLSNKESRTTKTTNKERKQR